VSAVMEAFVNGVSTLKVERVVGAGLPPPPARGPLPLPVAGRDGGETPRENGPPRRRPGAHWGSRRRGPECGWPGRCTVSSRASTAGCGDRRAEEPAAGRPPARHTGWRSF
jgi:hypothetical protein